MSTMCFTVKGRTLLFEMAQDPHPTLGGYCWNYKGRTNHDGYGMVQIDYVNYRVHRLMYEDMRGPIAPGLALLHGCDNRKCANPNHLKPGTHYENMREMHERGRAGDKTRKTTSQQRAAIRKSPKTVAQIAKFYGLSERRVREIRQGRKK